MCNYIGSVSKIPSHTCHKINKMQASFGGGNSPINSTDGSVGKACKPAVDGGKGIRPISIKNKALLTKLAYKRNSLLAKTLNYERRNGWTGSKIINSSKFLETDLSVLKDNVLDGNSVRIVLVYSLVRQASPRLNPT